MTNHVLIVDGEVVQADLTRRPPEGYVEAPAHVVPGFRFEDGEFLEPLPEEPAPAPIPGRVTARQFRMQLRKDGLTDIVKAWVATQDPLVQDAFEYSGTFLRNDPMMDAGFAALGFSTERGDKFFADAFAL